MFGTVEGVVTPLFDIGLKIPKVALTGNELIMLRTSFSLGVEFIW